MDIEPRRTMDSPLDLDALDAQALGTQAKEAYHLISGDSDHRLGVVVTASPDGQLDHSIELLIRIFPGRNELQLPQMERALEMTRELKERGYQFIHEDGGWVSCQRALPRAQVASECRALMDILMSFKSDEHLAENGTERRGC